MGETKVMDVSVFNVPKYAESYKFIVANVCAGSLWFYGAWNDAGDANKAAEKTGGVVVRNPAA